MLMFIKVERKKKKIIKQQLINEENELVEEEEEIRTIKVSTALQYILRRIERQF